MGFDPIFLLFRFDISLEGIYNRQKQKKVSMRRRTDPMGKTEPLVVVFAENDLHSFYKAYAAGMESAKILVCHDGPGWTKKGRAHLVLIDCGFRTRKGIALLRLIKEASPGTMVVIINEKSSEESVIEAFQAGARYYLRKPVSISELRRISMNLLELKKKSGERRSPFVDEAMPDPAPVGEILTGMPSNLIRAVHFIEENLGTPLDLETCAREGHLSKYQFCRAFKKHLGMTPMDFVNSMRISRAQELLKRDDLNITQVAHYVGFRDHGTFVKAYKKRTGVLPSEFKKALKNKTGA